MPDYRVQLDEFSGPLDLLLYLVRRNEIDLVDLPIAEITNQFLIFLQTLELIDLDSVGDFVVMASTLIEIKSRLVLPRVEDPEAEQALAAEEDPRTELIDQLLQYKQYKDAALALERQGELWQQRYTRQADERPQRGKDRSDDSFKEVELWDLVSALSRVLQKSVTEQTSSITYDDTPIAVYVEQIANLVRAAGRVSFSSLFEGANLRSRIIGIFLAILELLRHHGFRAEQPVDYGEIYVLPGLPAGDSLPAPDSNSEPREPASLAPVEGSP